MGKGVSFLLLALVLCYGVTVTMGHRGEKERRKERERREEKGEGSGREEWFLLPNSKPVMKTDAGEMRVVRSLGGRIIEKPLHIGFITMEPKTLFIPQYLDSSLILFVRTGMSVFHFYFYYIDYSHQLLHYPMEVKQIIRSKDKC